MKRKIRNILSGLFLFTVVVIPPCQAMAIHVVLEEVKITATYNGQDVVVAGDVQDGEEVVVQLIGQASEVELKQKGKVGGFLWMTVGHLVIDNAPNAYLVGFSKEIDDWRKTDDSRWRNLNLDYSSLLPAVKIEPAAQDVNTVFDDFIKLKKSDALYHLAGDVVQYESDSAGKRTFKARIHLPAKMPVATYQVKVLRIGDEGKVANVETGQLQLVETGFPKFVSRMAFDKSLFYGIMSTATAIFAGLFMGVLFKDKGGAH